MKIAIPLLLLASCTNSGSVDGPKVRAIACAGAQAIQTFMCGERPLLNLSPPSSGGDTGDHDAEEKANLEEAPHEDRSVAAAPEGEERAARVRSAAPGSAEGVGSPLGGADASIDVPRSAVRMRAPHVCAARVGRAGGRCVGGRGQHPDRAL